MNSIGYSGSSTYAQIKDSFLIDVNKPGLENLDKDGTKTGIKKAAGEFESMFIYMVLKKMREAIPKSDFLHSQKGEDVYNSLFDLEISKELSKNKGLGLADMIVKEFGDRKSEKIKNYNNGFNESSTVNNKF